MAASGDRDHSAESRRILDRVAHEADSGGFTVLGRTATRARNHLSASDADQTDWAEVWGTRIGRTIGVAAIAALLLWALIMLVGA